MRYLWGPTGIVARQTSGGTVSWYLADPIGTVRDLINSSGAIIDHVDFSAFGTVLDESSPANGDRMMGFAGLERDTVTGLNLAVFREENLQTGRWDSQDPLGYNAGQDNLSSYAANDPSNFVDPTGLDTWDFTLIVPLADAFLTWRRESQRAVDLDAQLVENQRLQRDSGQGGPFEDQELDQGPQGRKGPLNSGSQSRYFGGSTQQGWTGTKNMVLLAGTQTLEELGLQALSSGIPLSNDCKGALRKSGRARFVQKLGEQAIQDMAIHHRIPLEWAHLFPTRHPNDIANLVAVAQDVHNRIGAIWTRFRSGLQGRIPTVAEVLEVVRQIDAEFGHQFTSLK